MTIRISLLKNLTKIIRKYEDLRMVGISCYANLFESCEQLQKLLIDNELIEALELCLDDYYTSIIRLLNNLSSLNEMNAIFKSKFFHSFQNSIPLCLLSIYSQIPAFKSRNCF